MDNRFGRRITEEQGFLRRGLGLTIQSADQNHNSTQFCNRLRCSIKHNSFDGTQIDPRGKLKPIKPSFQPLSGKERAGSSSKTISTSCICRRPLQAQHHPKSLRQNAISRRQPATCRSNRNQEDNEFLPNKMELFESNGQQDDNVDSGSTSTSLEGFESAIFNEIPSYANKSSIHCNAASTSKPTQLIIGRSSLRIQDSPSNSLVQRPNITSHKLNHAAKPGSGPGAQKTNLKNLRCTSISDVFPLGCSSPGYIRDRPMDLARNRFSAGESSSTRSKAVSTISGSVSTRPSTSGTRLSISERVVCQSVSRRIRNRPTTGASALSVRTRGTLAAERRMMLSIPGNGSILNRSILAPQIQHSQLSIPEITQESSSRSFTMEMPNFFHRAAGRPGSSHQSSRSRSVPILEDQDSELQIVNSSLGSGDGYHHFNIEGLAEVLLALEQIEQDEELSYEQLLVLETSLFLGGLSFHDRHRDMRLDIDNMSYEELLALEEKMGNVSTALTDDQLSKCLKTSIYKSTTRFRETNISDVDDMKCSICQEEYADGDELGKLPCKHCYHASCIQHWLQQKNWCPICKSCTLP